MPALISRILTIALVAYSFFELRGSSGGNLPVSSTAAKFLFAVQLFLSVLFFIIPFFPETIHFGSRRLSDYPPETLDRIMPLVRDMIALMGCIFALYFAVNIHLLIRQAQSSSPRDAAREIVATEPWLVGGLLLAQGIIVVYYLRRFDAVAAASPNAGIGDDI